MTRPSMQLRHIRARERRLARRAAQADMEATLRAAMQADRVVLRQRERDDPVTTDVHEKAQYVYPKKETAP